jgi:hypothetical protein
MNTEWSIQSRGDVCASSGKQFEEGEFFYTLLYEEKLGFRREDLSEAAFKERPADAPQPFSFWRLKYQPPPPPAPEALGKQTAEDLLRRYMADGGSQYANARYILALMLERKRLMREVETKRDEQGSLVRIYEHVKTGEVFLIPDPQLRLDQIAAVQAEVAGQLAG